MSTLKMNGAIICGQIQQTPNVIKTEPFVLKQKSAEEEMEEYLQGFQYNRKCCHNSIETVKLQSILDFLLINLNILIL